MMRPGLPMALFLGLMRSPRIAGFIVNSTPTTQTALCLRGADHLSSLATVVHPRRISKLDKRLARKKGRTTGGAVYVRGYTEDEGAAFGDCTIPSTLCPVKDKYHGPSHDFRTVCQSNYRTVVVAFGLTEKEIEAAEAVLQSEGMSWLFPAGLRSVRICRAEDAEDTGGPTTLRGVVLDSNREGGLSAHANDGVISSMGLPKMLMFLSTVVGTGDGEENGRVISPLLGPVMEALDACEAVPPVILSFPLATAFTEDELDRGRLPRENGLATPMRLRDTEWMPFQESVKIAMNLELDGAWVESAASPGGRRWDASKVVVIDGLVDEDLSRGLLDLITEPGWATTESIHDANTRVDHHPPTSKWERGLSDVDLEELDDGYGGGGVQKSEKDRTKGGWGLKEEAIEWLCQEGEHPMLVEVQSRVQKLYPEYCICHMPEAVLGPSTPRMVANAPVYGDRFSWHVDADPAVLPPSPWRDHFGTYTNREPGMPLFATLLIYLDAGWNREFDAETLFLDAPTDTGVFVRPRQGRAVLMDQDITHRISTPSQIAKRPRYSLVWKLVFFPAAGNLDADEEGKASSDASNVASRWEPSIALRVWGDPVRFGSAVAECGSNPPPVHAHRARETVDLVRPHEGAGDTVGAVSYVGDKEQRRGPERLDWQRLSLESVEVKAAGAKGRGVFATRPISKGEVIGFYTGEVLSTNELDTCYPNFEGSEYVMQIGPDTYIDAKDPEKSSFTRYINHSWKSPNLIVELQTITTGPDNPGFISPSSPASHAVALCAARNLNKGEELTLDYGEGYFDDEDSEGNVIEDGQEMRDILGGVDWGCAAFSMDKKPS